MTPVPAVGVAFVESGLNQFDPSGSSNDFEWQPAPGYDEGGSELILTQGEDGSQTRFLQLEPGTKSDEVITHDFYEEVYIISGGLIDTRLDEVFTAGMYACRTPGMEHGPYEAPVGCLTIEFRYYD